MSRRFYISVNGLDITGFIAQGGFKHTRNDIDSSNAGRTLSGLMNRGRVTSKVKLEIKCRPLLQHEAEAVLNAIYPEYVTVNYVDPRQGERTGVQFYSNNVPSTLHFIDEDGIEHWKDISFPLVER